MTATLTLASPYAVARRMRLPPINPTMTAVDAGYALVDAGFAVLPVDNATKHAGSVLKNDWPDKTGRTRDYVDRWWGAGQDYAMAVHTGACRPAVVVIDADDAEKMPADLLHALIEMPFTSSRDNDSERGHYWATVPAGRDLGSSEGDLKGFGVDVRAGNTVAVAWGRHKEASDGGRYLTEGGELPELPEWIACRLRDRGITGHADDADVTAFLAALPGGACPEIADRVRVGVAELNEARASHDRGGPGRHGPGLRIVKGLVRLGERRFPGVREALGAIEGAFLAGRERDFGGRADWTSSLRGAVGAMAADPSPASEHYKPGPETMLTAMQARQESERVSVSTAPEIEPVETRENPLRARLFDREALRSIPPVRWLIEGTLPEHSVTVLSGRTQTLKTFLALDMALSHATGKEWFGRAAGRGRVLLVLAEGFDGIAGRIAAWEAEHDDVPKDALTVLRGAVQLAEAQQMADLAEIVAEDGYSLVVLDTYAKMTVGLVENDNDHATKATEALYRIADATAEGRGAVLVIAHATKYRDDGTGKRTTRGAGALVDNIDGAYDLERINETEVLVERTKVKEAELHDTFRVTFRTSGPSIVLDYSPIDAEDIPVRQSGQQQGAASNRQRVLNILGDGRASADATYLAGRLEVTPQTARNYLAVLEGTGKVVRQGDERHPRYALPEAQPSGEAS